MYRLLCLITVAASALAAPPPDIRRLLDWAARNPQDPAFAAALTEAMGAKAIRAGTAVIGEGADFLWAVEAASVPTLVVNDQPAGKLSRLSNSSLWFYKGTLETGRSHNFHYLVDGKRFGGRMDVPAYPPECYAQPGVPQGKLSEKITHTSRIYPGMTSEYWVYVPAAYDGSKAAALMVWQDGQNHIQRDGAARTLNVVDNLIHAGKIPVMIQVFIAPGMREGQRMRSIQYDTVDDTYARFLRDEILAEVQSRYKIRTDAYSRGIAGNSSGGICAFNAAWQMPEQFSRVLSRIGSFTSIQWHPGRLEGGNVYPFKIRKEPKRNIRVWLQDGSEDLENSHGSWPLQNIQMANSLKMMEYDFHFSWGNGSHNAAHGNAELPAALSWLWRGYDSAKTSEQFRMEEEEKGKPYFRVKALNR